MSLTTNALVTVECNYFLGGFFFFFFLVFMSWKGCLIYNNYYILSNLLFMTNGLNGNGSTYRALRDTIKSTLSDLLGTYTYTGNKVQPAIKVDLGTASSSTAPVVKGLEVIIQPSTEIVLKPMFGAYEETSTTYVILKQWDVTQGILPALNRLVAALPNIRRIVRVPRYTEIDNIESCTIQVIDVSMVLENLIAA